MTNSRQFKIYQDGLKQTTTKAYKHEDVSGKKIETAQVFLEGNIMAPVEQVFQLCCPVEEYKWIPGWKCHIIHCPNNRVEKGTVFEEIFSAPFLQGGFRGKTTWTAVHHDKDLHQLHFRLDNNVSSSLYKIEMFGDDQGGTTARLDFTYTALNHKGSRMIKNNVQDKILSMIKILSISLKTYCEQNRMIKLSDLQKLIRMEQGLSLSDKFHMVVNRLLINHVKDINRNRFINTFNKVDVAT